MRKSHILKLLCTLSSLYLILQFVILPLIFHEKVNRCRRVFFDCKLSPAHFDQAIFSVSRILTFVYKDDLFLFLVVFFFFFFFVFLWMLMCWLLYVVGFAYIFNEYCWACLMGGKTRFGPNFFSCECFFCHLCILVLLTFLSFSPRPSTTTRCIMVKRDCANVPCTVDVDDQCLLICVNWFSLLAFMICEFSTYTFSHLVHFPWKGVLLPSVSLPPCVGLVNHLSLNLKAASHVIHYIIMSVFQMKKKADRQVKYWYIYCEPY